MCIKICIANILYVNLLPATSLESQYNARNRGTLRKKQLAEVAYIIHTHHRRKQRKKVQFLPLMVDTSSLCVCVLPLIKQIHLKIRGAISGVSDTRKIILRKLSSSCKFRSQTRHSRGNEGADEFSVRGTRLPNKIDEISSARGLSRFIIDRTLVFSRGLVRTRRRRGGSVENSFIKGARSGSV